jgi:hypothetical protein
MDPGVHARIKIAWRGYYRCPGSSIGGVVQAVSSTGKVTRIRLDDVADSYVLTDHLELSPAFRALVARARPRGDAAAAVPPIS